MPYMDLDDVSIWYEDAGEGPLAYVYCHGLRGYGHNFVDELPFWAEQFGRAVTWDNRGWGRSGSARKYNLPLIAGDLAALLDRLGVEKTVVHGVSWGGVVAQGFALDHLDRCAAVIVDSSSSEVNVASSEHWYGRGEVARLGASGGDEDDFEPAFPGHERPDPESVAVPTDQLDSYVARARTIAGLREHPLTPRLKQITCPVLVVGAGKDGTAGAAGSVIMARNLPNARVEIFQDAGHGVFQHDREGFRALVLEFCREHGIIAS